MTWLGDFAADQTFDHKWATVTTTGAPTQLAGSPVISVYIDNSTTQITAGITLSVDFDGVTGMNNVRIVATTANGYTSGSNFQIVITTGTVGGTSVVGYVVGSFSINARAALRPTTAGRTLDVSAGGEAGVDWANVGSPTTTVDLSGTTIKTTQKVDVDTIKTNPVVNGGTITFPTTATLASTTNITAGTVTTATNVTTVNGLAANVITATSIAADAITDAKVASDVTIASVTGAVGSVTGAVGSVTGNVGGNVTGSVGSVVGAVGSVTGAVGSVTGNVGGNVTGSVGSLATQAKSDVNAEVVDCLNVDTYAEPGQGAPAATTTLVGKLGYVYKFLRNKRTQTSTTLSIFNDDAATVDQKATVSDDGTTYTSGEIASGP